MSLRKSQKTGVAKTAAKAVTLIQIAKPMAGAVKSFRRARAGKGLRKQSSGRRPGAVLIGLLGIGGIAAAVAKKRAKSQDLGYGPPNESVPSHENLAPAKAAAGQATNGESSETETETAEPEAAGSPGDDAGTDEPAREETAEKAG
jgi:hypothetical protein